MRTMVLALAVVVGWIGVGPVPVLGARLAAQEVADPPEAVVTVTGNALHESTGAPISGVGVRLAHSDLTVAVETDRMGQFRLEGIPAGTYSISLVHRDYAPLEGEMTIDRSGEFFMAMTPLDLDRSGATGIVGVVRDMGSGGPVPDVVVDVPALGRAATSDSEGRFTLGDLVPGIHEVVFTHVGYGPRVDTATVVGGRVSRLDVGLASEAIELTPIEVTVERRDLASDRESMTGIVGVVRDVASGRVVPEVVVNVPLLGRVATSDSEGRFSMGELAPGSHEIVFTHLGYGRRVDTVAVVGGRVSRVNVGLAVEAIELTPIEVTVERQDFALQRVGFYEREEDGWGKFLDREDIELWHPIDLTDALIRFPGVKIVHDPRMPSQRYLLFRRAGVECFPAVYLDGMLMHVGGRSSAAGINDIIDPIAVAGVEVYRSSAGMPPQYWGTGSFCGVVLIWSRRS